LVPWEPRYAFAVASAFTGLGDGERANQFRAKAYELEPLRRTVFDEQQTVARTQAIEKIHTALSRILPTWQHAVSTDSVAGLAERVISAHIMDSIALWAYFVPQRYQAGDVAAVDHIGQFRINDPTQTLEKRLVRGIPWELAATALFMELGSRCDTGAVLVDVGANIGTHTVALASKFAGTVLAFEPVPSNYAALMENLALNNIGNCLAVQKACGAQAAEGKMTRVDPRNPGKARLVAGDGIEITTLDAEVQALGRPVAFIKIDVEGGEQDVLAGAMETLHRDRPIIFCEVMGDRRRKLTMERLAPLGYAMFPFDSNECLYFPVSAPDYVAELLKTRKPVEKGEDVRLGIL
jgi:FkbM family methyltransferase